jgi:hypothetical protein
MPHCPDCHTDQVIKNGSIHTGKQKYACNACGRHCVDAPQFRIISDETKALIDRTYAVGRQTGRLRTVMAGFACGSMVHFSLFWENCARRAQFFQKKDGRFRPAGGKSHPLDGGPRNSCD